MLDIQDLTIEFGARPLMEGVSLQFFPGNRYGLVGANGSGKSTFLRVLRNEESHYQGVIQWPKDTSVGFLRQDHFQYENTPIYDVVLQGRPLLWEALTRQKELESLPEMSLEQANIYAETMSTIERQDGFLAPAEIPRILNGLGIIESKHHQTVSTLSGGFKLRVMLAQLLYSKPEILLLDEPTNHLDILSIQWLEGYLRQFEGLLLVVSHDQAFLNTVCTHIADIDYGTVKIYTGNYTAFVSAKALEKEQKELALASQEKKKAELQAFVDRFRAKASKASAAQSRVKMIEKMEAIDIVPSSRQYPRFQFEQVRPSGLIPLRVDSVSKSYGNTQVLNNIGFEVERGDRIALIGPNGIGKSTLLKIIMNQLEADTGIAQWGHEVYPAYFPQDYKEELSPEQTLYDWLYGFDTAADIGTIRGILGRMLFSGDDVKHKIATLSGGESTRLIFGKIMLLPNNVLVLDEPTNHLDLEAIDMLTQALKNYDGTLIFVSHHRHFVSEVANRILEITPEGLTDFKGSYQDYLDQAGDDHLNRSESAKKQDISDEKIERQLSYAERKAHQRRLEQLEKLIAQSEGEIEGLEQKTEDLQSQLALAYEGKTEQTPEALMETLEHCQMQLEEAMNLWESQEEELARLKEEFVE